MCWKIVRLDFSNNLAHFGELGIGIEETSERVRSDTLFSAWVSTYAKLFGKDNVGDLLDKFIKNPQSIFRISSTFVYSQKGSRYTYYLPKPLLLPNGYPEDDLKFTKVYKKLNYLPLKVWHRWYQTQKGFTEDDGYELENYPDVTEDLNQAGTFDYPETYKIRLVPKVAVDRTTRATNFYHTGFVQFLSKPDEDKQAGLYFLIKFPKPVDDKLVQRLKLALDLLGEEGLGGERSSGAGRFKPDWVDEEDREFEKDWKSILEPSEVNKPKYCLISLYWQSALPDELLDQSDAYEIQERGGWIGSPFSGRQLRRQSLRMFTEGSVFPFSPHGELADVTPKEFNNYPDTHKIYRSGISFSLPINAPE
ncbi:type III-A CRISPR-associated RAMP protein Csm4 [Nostoc sp. TCL26-01]|uniref:type III-A CRISPR-associated RAMP protein Csm4 n=1 Tax=Nostoc sp. TCL26-01 TaxID=2576904 RepID=UPI0015BBF2FE|nr:type III-A CRISPR-associated RAMP protein Csm4 [Nostoc sp. TCL26-01]QLE58530.1 type III-A CRISPR-associated RAMP protein Csm4 [Nostoc sp. TCL26-01]